MEKKNQPRKNLTNLTNFNIPLHLLVIKNNYLTMKIYQFLSILD